jgi:hypothetical protein
MLKYETKVEFCYQNLPAVRRRPIPLIFFFTSINPLFRYYEHICVCVTCRNTSNSLSPTLAIKLEKLNTE